MCGGAKVPRWCSSGAEVVQRLMGRLQVQWWCRCRGAEQEAQRAKKVQVSFRLQLQRSC